MNNYKITFSDLKTISYETEKENNQYFVDYLNSFNGDNILEKFKNIMKIWECDVTPTLELALEKTLQFKISYLLSEISPEIDDPIIISNDDFNCMINIPKIFTLTSEVFPIYEIIKEIDIFNIKINLSDLENFQRKEIIDNLPATTYNVILNSIIEDKSKFLKFSNPVLEKMRLNFLTNDPYFFLKGLFSKYSKDYFRDILYILSKKIDGDILLNSTISDIEYYVKKYNDEIYEQDKKNAQSN